MKLYVRSEISCAHRLELSYESECNRLHGHNYLVEVWVEGELNRDGMIVDVSEVKRVLKEFDHCFLNDVIRQPTMENFARLIAKRVKGLGSNIKKVVVRVWEDRDSYAEEEL